MPYKVEFNGLEVMAQAPDEQPTNFQYKKPNTPPVPTPISVGTDIFFMMKVLDFTV